ncbi:MAG: hypothetical protein HZB98_04910 [Bacteroidia bacterium]|nr:hypothetical protein [Bacteroidia bacterium]
MRRILFTLILSAVLTIAVNAQDYKTGIGLRGGTAWGLTLKHFVSER